MATGILGIGASALLANQRALATVSHNIANATVAGFSRQSVEFEARSAQLRGSDFFGNGVDIANVRRHVDNFINEQIYADTASQGSLATQQSYLVRVDNFLGSASTGLSAAFDQFFSSLQDMSLDPSSIPQREVVLQQAGTLVERFNNFDQLVNGMERELNLQIEDQVSQVNSIASSLAQLNEKISISTGQGDGQAGSDLLDQRDRLYTQLSALVPISTVTQSDGSTNVFIGKGQALVVGTNAHQLATQPNDLDSSRLEVAYGGVATNTISDAITGGSLGGLLATRQAVLEPAVNQVGRLAVAVEQAVNGQHHLGMDLNGVLGADLFSMGQPQVAGAATNPGVTTLAVAITDPVLLTAADYRIDVDAGSNYQLTNLNDGSVTTLGAVPPGPATVPVTVDGMTIDLDPAAAVGDRFLLQPTRDLAGSLSLAISDPRQLAAAVPVVATTDINNVGSLDIAGLTMVDASNAAFSTTAGALTPPLLIEFTGPNSFDLYDNTAPGSPVLLEGGIAYIPGGEIFPTGGGLDFGYRAQLAGGAVNGDSLRIDYNGSGLGDNQNMLALISQQEQGLLLNGTASYQESYQQLVGEVGARTSRGAINLDAVGFTLEQAQFRQQSVSGVNLDEEAAKLLEFQQAYQAAAQTIRAADTLFQSLLQVI